METFLGISTGRSLRVLYEKIPWHCHSESPRGSDHLHAAAGESERKGKAFFGGVLSGVVEPIGAEVPLLLRQRRHQLHRSSSEAHLASNESAGAQR